MTLFSDNQKSRLVSIAATPGRTATRTIVASLIASAITVTLVLWLLPVG
jgi:hypothetical protein